MSSSDIKMESAESSSVVDLSKDDSQCSICLQDITNKCNSDSCWHTFCFECLRRWSDVKAYCPLCKNTFKNIHHSFTSHGLHETYNVPSQKVFDHETTMHLSIVGNHRPIHDQVIGNVFDCDCGLLWMNRLAAETSNDQVRRALSEVQCLMNETSDDDQMDFGTGGQKTFGVAVADRVVGGFGRSGGGVGRSGGGVGRSGGGDIPGVAVGGMRGYEGKFNAKAADDGGSSGAASGVSDEIYKSYDESQLIKVSRMNEDTCPSKEQPLVDGAPAGAPDAAQNSDRVLWESNKSSGVVATVRRSGPLSVLIFSSISFFTLLRTRLR